MPERDLARQLAELAQLRAQGVLSEAEFAQAKADLLGITTPAVPPVPASHEEPVNRIEPPAQTGEPRSKGPIDPTGAGPNASGRFCTMCGAPGHPTARFCASCGAAATGGGPSRSVVRGAAASASGQVIAVMRDGARRTGAWLGRQGISGARIAAGDWGGAACAALGGLAVMLVVSAVAIGIIAASAGAAFPIGSSLAAVAMATTLAVGGSLEIHGGGFADSIGAELDVLLLGPALAGFALTAGVFLGQLRRVSAPDVGEIVMRIIRTWIVFGGGLILVALVGRTDVGAGADVSGFGIGATASAGIVSTVVSGSVWLWVVLLAMVAWRLPDVLPARVRAWRDAAAAPAAGVAVTLAALGALAGLVLPFVPAVLGADSGDEFAPAIGGILLLGPNIALAGFAFALGVPVEGTLVASAVLGPAGADVSLLTLVEAEPTVLLATVVAALLVVVGGVVTAARLPGMTAGRIAVRFAGALAMTMTGAAILTSASASGSAAFGEIDTGFGIAILPAIALGALWGLIGGWLGAVLASWMRPARFGTAHPAASPRSPFVQPHPSANGAWWMQQPSATAGVPGPPGGPPASSTPQVSPDELVRRLGELAEQHARGMLSDEEFARAKSGLLGPR